MSLFKNWRFLPFIWISGMLNVNYLLTSERAGYYWYRAAFEFSCGMFCSEIVTSLAKWMYLIMRKKTSLLQKTLVPQQKENYFSSLLLGNYQPAIVWEWLIASWSKKLKIKSSLTQYLCCVFTQFSQIAKLQLPPKVTY